MPDAGRNRKARSEALVLKKRLTLGNTPSTKRHSQGGK
jgi:hypothetical protein